MNRSTRRRLLVATASLAMPRWAFSQAAARFHRLGWLSSSDLSKEPHYVAFLQRLGELGFAEGRNLVIERRQAGNRLERLPPLAAELAKLHCDVFFAGGTEANLSALLNASRDTPVVFIAVDFDPVATGDVASLARPGGRVTGVTALQSTLPAKRLELLKEALPGVGKVAVLTNNESTAQLVLTQGTARRLGIEVHVVDLKRPPFDYEAGFSDAVRAKAQALVVLGSGLWVPARSKIHQLAMKARLPCIFHQSLWVETGGLMSYGFSFPAMYRRGADMVASILRGANVAEIPVEQPTAYELAVNLRTAKALGISIPQSILIRADRVID